MKWNRVQWGTQFFVLGRLEQARQVKNLLYRHDKTNEPTKGWPLSNVLRESPLDSVSTAGKCHPSLVSLESTQEGPLLNVLHESPLAWVSTAGKGHPSLILTCLYDNVLFAPEGERQDTLGGVVAGEITEHGCSYFHILKKSKSLQTKVRKYWFKLFIV